jgi:hypothetical protein
MAQHDFSILKWFIFPLVTVGLSGGIAYFNLTTFGLEGSILYLIALGVVNAISLVLLKFAGSTKRPVRHASYTFEGLLVLALLLNASYSLSAQRDLSLVAQAGASHERSLEQVSKLKSGRAQREAIGQLGNVVNIRAAYGAFDRFLFWIMICELGLSLGGLFTVYGLAAIRPGGRRMPRHAFIGSRGVTVAPSDARRPGPGFNPPQKANGGQVNANGSTPEAERKQAEAFRITGQSSGVRVRQGGQYRGHIAWPRYLENVGDPQRPTENEIKSLLTRE